MAIIMQNPDNVPSGVSTGYQLQNELLYAGNTGFCNVQFSEDYTKILGGSIFELNGKLVKVTSDESMNSGISPPSGSTYFYIYARINTTGGLSFSFGSNPPVWDSDKCGFYNYDMRVLAKVAGMGNGKFKQVSFDTDFSNSYLVKPQESDSKTNIFYMDSMGGNNTSGLDVVAGIEDEIFYLLLTAGWYHIELEAAGGGYNWGGPISESNASHGGDGGFLSRIFHIPYITNAKASVGIPGKSLNVQNTVATDGGASTFEVPELGISLIAYGGKKGVIGFSPSKGADGGNNINPDTGGGGRGGSYGGFTPERCRITIYEFS